MREEEDEPRAEDSHGKKRDYGIIAIILLVVMVAWIVLGLVAFIYSLVCFGKSGTTSQHVLGLALAFFFGPFYFIYYRLSKTYCKSLQPPNTQRQAGGAATCRKK